MGGKVWEERGGEGGKDECGLTKPGEYTKEDRSTIKRAESALCQGPVVVLLVNRPSGSLIGLPH